MSDDLQNVLPGMQRSEAKMSGIAERDLGMARVAVSAGDEWVSRAYRIVEHLARLHTEFTADHVHRAASVFGLPSAPDPRAWGPVMMRARKTGIIFKTGKYVHSTRPECHRRPIPVYMSMIYRGPFNTPDSGEEKNG